MDRHGVPTFTDIEASSLDGGYPIEVGWSRWAPDSVEPVTRSILIRPHADWQRRMKWSAEAESLHKITQDQLARDGTAASDAARTVAEALTGAISLSDAPMVDDVWLGLLMDAADIGQRHRPRLISTDAAFSTVPSGRLRAAMDWAQGACPVRHRAGADAERWARIWRHTTDEKGG